MDKLKKEFHGLMRLDVSNQILTTRHWLYTWMGIGGVETEEELSISFKDLTVWLINQQNSSDIDISHNAGVIHNWLIEKILPHKKRWLFAHHKHLMTLGQKSTSALEGVNHTIKVKAAKVFTPNITLLESYKTIDTQQENRMNKWKKQVMSQFEGEPTWTD